MSVHTGSSPRGRGTQTAVQHRRGLRRFIPAWAGNTPALPGRTIPPSVHPRVGGEHPSLVNVPLDLCGSSPRGRGTHAVLDLHVAARRFIPAWAGNTRGPSSSCGNSPVHPRVGGEHARRDVLIELAYGSSPRGRGTRGDGCRHAGRLRFIPAWAGNTSVYRRFWERLAVHPRVGGEHGWAVIIGIVVTGSSPRGRGTPAVDGAHRRHSRFIPAWAGNTSRGNRSAREWAVHPRVGGEHCETADPCLAWSGSSPRGRGTQVLV